MQKRAHIYYSGQVQGVGFRFTAEHVAQAMDVLGWVRNLPDGRVEIVAEAGEEILVNFMEEIEREMRGYINEKTVKFEDPTGEFPRFGIKF